MESLFEFRLRPVREVQLGYIPAESRSDSSWYYLSDGFYRFKVGDRYLFEYVEKGADGQNCWESYYLAAAWDDIMRLLPKTLEPVPDSVIEQLNPEGCTFPKLVGPAAQCMDDRKMDLRYLKDAPEVWIWSHGHIVTITWQTEGRRADGGPVWSAPSGSFSLDRGEYIRQVTEFHESLMEEMRERVLHLTLSFSRPDVRLNLVEMRSEQAERRSRLERILGEIER